MNSIDQQFVEFIVKSLVGNPDAVSIVRTIDEKGVLLELTVDPNDLGRVIGKRGATAQSLRTLLRALGTKNDARYNLKIVDSDAGFRPAPPPVTATASNDPTSASDTDDDEQDVPEDVIEQQSNEPEDNSKLARTRKELADLDDLDV